MEIRKRIKQKLVHYFIRKELKKLKESEDMKDLLKFLEGKKTYFVAIAIGILSALKFLGKLDEGTYLAILGFLTGGGFAALRAAKK